MWQVRKHRIDLMNTEGHQPNQSMAEGVVREIQKKHYRAIFAKQIPHKLWDYVLRWACKIQRITYVSSHGVNGAVPLEDVTGERVDISDYLDFGIYD
jgi:hypothetical protein